MSDEIKQQVESLMIELVGLRALYDFLVVCDETNNTPARIDRNELYVDITVEPVKAEQIYDVKENLVSKNNMKAIPKISEDM